MNDENLILKHWVKSVRSVWHLKISKTKTIPNQKKNKKNNNRGFCDDLELQFSEWSKKNDDTERHKHKVIENKSHKSISFTT